MLDADSCCVCRIFKELSDKIEIPDWIQFWQSFEHECGIGSCRMHLAHMKEVPAALELLCLSCVHRQ